jgi:precorrin-3B synthase
MKSAAIKGWCPGALRPMQSGDGLVVRLRPHQGRITRHQAIAIADLAACFGNGLIDLTARANLQLRGVREAGHQPLIDALRDLGLIDADVATEVRRNILVSPFWREGDDTPTLAADLAQALAATSLDLPAKFGFAVDCGATRALAQASADIRIERGEDQSLIVRAEGAATGRAVARSGAVATALSLAQWFAASGGVRDGRGRMAAHLKGGATLPAALSGDTRPAPAIDPPRPSLRDDGALVGLAFGQIEATTLKALARGAAALRMTPWLMILAEGLDEMPRLDGLVTDADDPILRVVACTGAPGCREAQADTRTLAAMLAPHLGPDRLLHVSGCAKGCAHPQAAPLTLVATRHGFDLVRDGAAHDEPALRGLLPARLAADPALLAGAD